MARNRDVPDLLEKFMEECGTSERWITVAEFRTYFALDEQYSPAISGFFRRIHQGSFFSCPYRVERIEKTSIDTPQRRIIKRYLIKRRPGSADAPAAHWLVETENPDPRMQAQRIHERPTGIDRCQSPEKRAGPF